MNKLLICSVISAICCLATASVDAQQFPSSTIQWETNPYAASQKAGAESKLVLLHFVADWCGPCKNQKRFVFSSPAVARAINQIAVPVIVDIDANKALAQELNVQTIPYDVFLTPGGEVVAQRKSPIDTNNFITMCDSVGLQGAPAASQAREAFARLKQGASSMGLPVAERSNFRAPGPSEVSSISASSEGQRLARQSNFRQRINQPAGVANREKPKTLDPRTELKQAFAGLVTDFSNSAGKQPTNSRFFKIPETRLDDPAAAYDPATNEFHPHRMAEHLERDAFLSKARPGFNVPRQAAPATPVRITENHFFNVGKDAKMTAVSAVPGLEVSEMFSPTTGRRVSPYAAGQSVARIHKEAPKQPVMPVNEVKIVASSNARIESFKNSETDFAQQASMIKDDSSPQQTMNLGTTLSANPVDDFALHGKCPVALILEGQWVEGDARWGIIHRDRTYLFSSQANYDLFKTNPDRYSPVLSGFDPVIFHQQGKLLDGLEENGVFMGKDDKQHIILFQSPETRATFQSNPKLYMDTVRQAVYSASRDTNEM